MSQKLDGVRPILWFHFVHVLLLSPVVFFKVDGKEPILRDITRYYELINNTLRTAMAVKTILDWDAKGVKNIQKHVHAFLVWWFSQATLWAKCQWFNVGNCGQWETTHGSGHRVNWCYFLFTKVVYGVQNRKTRRKFYFFVVSKSSQFRWENTLVSISGGSGIRPSCSSCLIKPKSNGYKRNVVNTSIELHLFEVINSYYFLCNLFSSYGGLWNWTLYAFVVLEVHVTKKSDTEKYKSNRTDRTSASSNGKYYCWLCCSPQLVSPRCFEKLSAKRPLNENVYVELIKWC